jgi:hypothetical protein
LRSIRRDTPTTERSAWNCAKDCYNSALACSAPSRSSMLTAML